MAAGEEESSRGRDGGFRDAGAGVPGIDLKSGMPGTDRWEGSLMSMSEVWLLTNYCR
jgi:hypothetical protein